MLTKCYYAQNNASIFYAGLLTPKCNLKDTCNIIYNILYYAGPLSWIHRPEEALGIQSELIFVNGIVTYPRNETLVHQQLSLHQLHPHPSQRLTKRFFSVTWRHTFNIDAESEGSTRFRNPRARDCSDPSGARALLRARGFLKSVDPIEQSV